jgi:hypothetical protein
MQPLFAISILSFFVLVMAGVAIARHVRIVCSSASLQTDHNFSHYLFAAAQAAAGPNTGTRAPRSVPDQTIQEIMANKSWNQPPEIITSRPDPDAQLTDEQKNAHRAHRGHKSPQSSHEDGHERLDWAYFNKDLGDLTDPYRTPRLRVNSRDKATSPTRF